MSNTTEEKLVLEIVGQVFKKPQREIHQGKNYYTALENTHSMLAINRDPESLIVTLDMPNKKITIGKVSGANSLIDDMEMDDYCMRIEARLDLVPDLEAWNAYSEGRPHRDHTRHSK